MDVHPSDGVNPPGPTTDEPFASEARYEIMIDTNGDAVADIAYQVRFSSPRAGRRLRRCAAWTASKPPGRARGGQVIVEGVPVSIGREAQVTQAGDYRFFAGWRSDSFFFDAGGLDQLFSSPARISSQIKTFAASRWKCPTRFWGLKRLACGHAR